MTHDPTTDGHQAGRQSDQRTTRFLGSLKDALVAASREEPTVRGAQSDAVEVDNQQNTALTPPPMPTASANTSRAAATPATEKSKRDTPPSAGSAARAVRGTSKPLEDQQIKLHKLPTTRAVKSSEAKKEPARTQLVRGKLKVERGDFEQDPVVGWVVIVGGPGIGNYRPIFEGNNSVGRGAGNRIPIDFDDEAISSEEQAYIRYDSSDRSFLFVPNLAKTNVVSVNNQKPTGAVTLNQMDVIMMGRTQLVFVPFCGSEFDWSALGETTKG